MGKTSFKTHDPFVILEHLDGNTPVHFASFVICYLLQMSQNRDDTQRRSEFDKLIRDLRLVNIFCIIAQYVNRALYRKEFEVIIQQQDLKDKKTLQDTDIKLAEATLGQQQRVEPKINSKIDPNDEDYQYRPTTQIDLAISMICKQYKKIFKWIMLAYTKMITFAEDLTNSLKELVLDILRIFIQTNQNKTEPLKNLSSIHFMTRSMLSLISTISYQFTIFRLIVILFYRKDNFVVDTEGKITKPELYSFNSQPLTEDENASYSAGHIIYYETAFSAILVIDYCMQIIAIMFMMIANMNINMGAETITDMMNEAKFKYKFFTFMITASLTNVGVFLFIQHEQQNYQFSLNKVTATIDFVIISLYFAFLLFVSIQNVQLPHPKKLIYYLDKTRYGKYLSLQVLVLFLLTAKFTLVIFGNMYWLAYFSFASLPKECNFSIIFMLFQFIQYTLFIPQIKNLYELSQREKDTLSISFRQKKQKFFNIEAAIGEMLEEQKNKNQFKHRDNVFNYNQVKKGKENVKKKLPSNMRIVSNHSFDHNDAYLHSIQKDIKESQLIKASDEEIKSGLSYEILEDGQKYIKMTDEVAKSCSLHEFYKSKPKFTKLTNYMNSIMRQKFYLEEMREVQQVSLDGKTQIINGEATKVEFSDIKMESKGFVTVLMYGLNFHDEDYYLDKQLILVSDKFKNETQFNEQVKKIWRTLKENGYDPACLTQENIKEKKLKNNPEKLEWEKMELFDCYRPYRGKVLIKRLRKALKAKGARGIIGLRSQFKIADVNGSGFLDLKEFTKAVKDFGVDIDPQDIKDLFKSLKIDGSGEISFDEFVCKVVGDINQFRRSLVERAFKTIDIKKYGAVDLEEFKQKYNASMHPDVRSGKKTEDEILIKFMETFEKYYAMFAENKAGLGDGRVTLEEFAEYYNYISCNIENDSKFDIMISNAWNLECSSNPNSEINDDDQCFIIKKDKYGDKKLYPKERLEDIREMHRFEKQDYENEMRFHLQYSLFSNSICDSKDIMSKYLHEILKRFLNQNCGVRKLSNSLVVQDDKRSYLEVRKFEGHFYETESKQLCNSIMNDVENLNKKLNEVYRRMANIIIDIQEELNPETEPDPTNKKLNSNSIRVKQPRTPEVMDSLAHKNKLLSILKNGYDFFGYKIDVPLERVVAGKKENKARNNIQALCRMFENCIDDLQSVKSVEQDTSVGQEKSLMFPLKLEKGVQFRLFKMIQAKYKLKEDEYKKNSQKSIATDGVVFTQTDLIRCMVRIDYQRDDNELTLLDQKREDLLFDFVDSKFQQLHKKLMQLFSFGIEMHVHKKKYKNEQTKDEEKAKRASCLDMHALELIELDPSEDSENAGKFKGFFYKDKEDTHKEMNPEQNGQVVSSCEFKNKTFDGWYCTDCNARQEKEDVEYSFDEQPFSFVFVCESNQCTCSSGKFLKEVSHLYLTTIYLYLCRQKEVLLRNLRSQETQQLQEQKVLRSK